MSQTEASQPAAHNRRRTYVINPSFQWKYALMTATAVFLITSILSSILYGLLHHQARMRMIQPETYTAEVTGVILMFGVAFAGISAIGVGIWCMLVTHRFCGPLYVMERYMVTLAQGKLPKMRNLRRKDEFKDFYETFGRAVDAIREGRTANLKALQDALASARAGLEGDDAKRRESLEAVIAQMSKLQEAAEKAVVEEHLQPPDVQTASDTPPATPVPNA